MRVVLQGHCMCRDRYLVTERRHVIQLNNAILALIYEELGGRGIEGKRGGREEGRWGRGRREGGGGVKVDLDANVGRDAKYLPNHDADCNVDRQSGSCKSIPANQQHPRHERTRKSKGSFGRSGR